MVKSIIAAAFIFTSPLLAHEGHDKTPGAVAAPHGGFIQGTDHFYWELVKTPGGVKLYPYDHDMKVVSPKDIDLTGTVTFPRKTKGEKVNFSQDHESFSAKIDGKGSHRYTLEIVIGYEAKKETLKFQVEPLE